MADRFSLLDKPASLDRGQGDIYAAGNPHIHLDPRVLRVAAGLVAERLILIDPAHAADYRARLAAFQQRLDQAIVKWETRSTPLIGSRVIVFHKDFHLTCWPGSA